MSSPLLTLRMKTARSRKHFNEFKRMVGLGPDALIPPKVTGISLGPDWILHLTVSDTNEPGPEVGIVLGDAIHQLRSALDHLVCALAMRTNPPDVCEKFNLAFPIMKDLHDFCAYRLVANGTLRSLVGASEFQLIEDAQPYKRNPIESETDPLYVLSKLDNIDKHRVIIDLDNRVSASGTIFSQSGPPVDFRVRKQRVPAETQPLELDVPYPSSPYTVQMDRIEPMVVVNEVERSVFPLFREMEARVNEILDAYEPFFSGPISHL